MSVENRQRQLGRTHETLIKFVSRNRNDDLQTPDVSESVDRIFSNPFQVHPLVDQISVKLSNYLEKFDIYGLEGKTVVIPVGSGISGGAFVRQSLTGEVISDYDWILGITESSELKRARVCSEDIDIDTYIAHLMSGKRSTSLRLINNASRNLLSSVNRNFPNFEPTVCNFINPTETNPIHVFEYQEQSDYYVKMMKRTSLKKSRYRMLNNLVDYFLVGYPEEIYNRSKDLLITSLKNEFNKDKKFKDFLLPQLSISLSSALTIKGKHIYPNFDKEAFARYYHQDSTLTLETESRVNGLVDQIRQLRHPLFIQYVNSLFR